MLIIPVLIMGAVVLRLENRCLLLDLVYLKRRQHEEHHVGEADEQHRTVQVYQLACSWNIGVGCFFKSLSIFCIN